MGRILVIAHRDELIRQACDKIARVTGETPEIEMAEYEARTDTAASRIIVSSVQTQNSQRKCQRCRGSGFIRANGFSFEGTLEGEKCANCGGRGYRYRMEKFSPSDFSLLIIDEAHHATAATYRRMIDWYSQSPDLKILGVTATPDRADESALGQIFETVAFEYEILEAIQDGWLVDIDQQYVAIEGLDLSGVGEVAGDLNQGELEQVMRRERVMQGVCDSTLRLSADQPTLLFTPSVEYAHMAADIFNRHRANCARAVDGTTNIDERREMVSSFARGEFQFFCNCAIFLEGFDEPRIGVVANARPTKSRALYCQVIGRGTRPLPGLVDGVETADERRSLIRASTKPSLLVLDFVGNSGRHKLISTADILGGNESDEIIDRARAIAQRKCAQGSRVNMKEEIEEAKQLVAEEEHKRRQSVVARAKFTTKKISPFDVWDITPQREPAWHVGRQPTEKMRLFLQKCGVETNGLTFVRAKQVIAEIILRRQKGLATFKQAKLLTKYGENPNSTFEEAGRIIDAIAKNGWQPLQATIF